MQQYLYFIWGEKAETSLSYDPTKKKKQQKVLILTIFLELFHLTLAWNSKKLFSEHCFLSAN